MQTVRDQKTGKTDKSSQCEFPTAMLMRAAIRQEFPLPWVLHNRAEGATASLLGQHIDINIVADWEFTATYRGGRVFGPCRPASLSQVVAFAKAYMVG